MAYENPDEGEQDIESEAPDIAKAQPDGPSKPYLRRMVEKLVEMMKGKGMLDDNELAALHRHARGHAGGVAYAPRRDLAKSSILKADDEKHLVYGLVYEPGVMDSQGDWADAGVIEKAAHTFMARHRTMKVDHRDPAPALTPVESYIAPADFELNGNAVKAGSWLMVVHVDTGQDAGERIWKQVKDDELSGFSMAGFGERTRRDLAAV